MKTKTKKRIFGTLTAIFGVWALKLASSDTEPISLMIAVGMLAFTFAMLFGYEANKE